MKTYAWLALGGCLLIASAAFQAKQVGKLKRELAALRAQLETAPPADQAGNPAPDPTLSDRISRLEKNLASLSAQTRAPAYPTGPQPPAEDLDQLQRKLFDPTTPDGERVKAMHVLRRNQKLTDDVILQNLSLLQSSTNAGLRREMLSQLEGSTNAALKQPLLQMLEGEKNDNGFREQLVNSLRKFVDDPAVESKLWDLAMHEPNARVRDQAREAIARAPATPERIEQFQAKASDPNASLDERLLSFRGLRLAKSHTPELVSEFAGLAQNTTDPIARANLFKAFNGLTDESLMLPLVNGLQDADPIVRQNAANALSEFPDPRVQQWLTHLIQNDNDPAVKREAHTALERTQRLTRRSQ